MLTIWLHVITKLALMNLTPVCPFTLYPDDYRLCAFGVVSEYLLPQLADALQVSPTWQYLKLHRYPPGKTWRWGEETFPWSVQKTICWWPRWTQAKESQAWRSLWIFIVTSGQLSHNEWFPGPAEDYSKKAVKAIAKEEETAKVKALKASAKGTKSIASFFAKKTWKTLPRKLWSFLNGTCSLLPY